MRLKLLVLFSTLLSIAVSAKQVLTTNIEKLDNGQWTVEYISHKPLRSISFVTAQDNSRSERWALITEGFKLQRLNNTDIITRFDGQFFTNVKFKLTPTYTHLPKYYAPFSPFSDGGMLIHSARFFACSDLCSPLENTWYLTLTVPDGDNIVIDGELHQKKVSWWDKNDGKKVYIGQQDIVEETGFVGVIDKAITQSQGKILQQFLPSMMAWLEVRYGRLTTKPMVFASFGSTEDGTFGQQGGALPDQVFMHWYGKLPDFNQNLAQHIWFFAHEAAHMYQRLNGTAISPVDNWLQEGHAEHLAKQIIMALYPLHRDFADNMSETAKQACKEHVSRSTLGQLVKKNQHKALYQCGLYIFDTINDATDKPDTVHVLWNQFISNIKSGDKVSGKELINLAAVEIELPEAKVQQLMFILR